MDEPLVKVEVDFSEAPQAEYDAFWDVLAQPSNVTFANGQPIFKDVSAELNQAIWEVLKDYGLMDMPGCEVSIMVE